MPSKGHAGGTSVDVYFEDVAETKQSRRQGQSIKTSQVQDTLSLELVNRVVAESRAKDIRPAWALNIVTSGIVVLAGCGSRLGDRTVLECPCVDVTI